MIQCEHKNSCLSSYWSGSRQVCRICSCVYTVSTKKLWPCIRCHNSGEQRRILTKFQHWDIKLQTSHQILAKSVNICNSYSKFSKVTRKHDFSGHVSSFSYYFSPRDRTECLGCVFCCADRYLLASQLQSIDARRVFPCLDEPDKKAVFNVSIIHPPGRSTACLLTVWVDSTIALCCIVNKYGHAPPLRDAAFPDCRQILQKRSISAGEMYSAMCNRMGRGDHFGLGLTYA